MPWFQEGEKNKLEIIFQDNNRPAKLYVRLFNDSRFNPSAWQGSYSYNLGNIVRPSTPNGYYYECTTAGTSGSSQPSWPTTIGSTVNDNTAVWTCRNIKTLSLANLQGEPSGNSYAAQELNRNDVDWPSLAIDVEDWQIGSLTTSFSASGSGWGPVTLAVIATSGIAWFWNLLSTPRTCGAGENIKITAKDKEK